MLRTLRDFAFDIWRGAIYAGARDTRKQRITRKRAARTRLDGRAACLPEEPRRARERRNRRRGCSGASCSRRMDLRRSLSPYRRAPARPCPRPAPAARVSAASIRPGNTTVARAFVAAGAGRVTHWSKVYGDRR
jgi:hypothetical protein